MGGVDDESIEPRFPFVRIDVPELDVDRASGELFGLGALGIEERDALTGSDAPHGLVRLIASFADHATALRAQATLASATPEWNASVDEIVGDAWRDAWREHFEPFELAPGIVVRPPWRELDDATEKIVLELEPGRAFGTGLHATTRLVAQALVRHREALADAEILDVGTGSGILAICALALGARRVRAIDNDADAIEVCRENAARNEVGDRLDADTTPAGTLDGTYPMVIANIEAFVLGPIAPAVQARVAPGGLLILSGILDGQQADMKAAYDELEPVEETRDGEWIAILLRRGASA